MGKCTDRILPARDASDEVHLGRPKQLRLVPKLVPKEQAEEHRDWHIVCDEGCGVPFTVKEDAPLGAENDDDDPPSTPPSGIWHKHAMPWEVLGADTLSLQPLSESNRSNTYAEPIDHPSNGAHVGEPTENGVRRF